MLREEQNLIMLNDALVGSKSMYHSENNALGGKKIHIRNYARWS